MNESVAAPNSESGQATAKRRGRGPDTKPRKRRTDDPASYLPHGTEAHRIAKDQGKHSGRVRGSRNGWTKAEQAIEWELAKAKAKLETDFWYAVGVWPTPEQRVRLYRSISPDLLARAAAMNERRAVRLAVVSYGEK